MREGITMNKYTNVLMSALLLCSAAFAVVDQNPISNGTTMVRNASGNSYEAVYHNPAILGVDKVPKGGLFIPLTCAGVGVWSDKLALSPFNKYVLDDMEQYSDLVAHILKKSFDLDGLNPDQVSDKLTEEFKGGLKVYGGARVSLLNFAWGQFGFDITTHTDEEMHMPEGPLFAIFSRDKGLLEGNTLDFSDFKQEGYWATDFTFHLGLPVQVPVLHKLFGLRYGAGGLGVRYVMGHSMLKAQMDDAHLAYKTNNQLEATGTMTVQTAGLGYSGPWRKDDLTGLPVNGHGVGIDLGGILYDKHGSLTVNVQNLGVLFWTNNLQEVKYRIQKENLDAYDIIKGIDEVGNDWDSLRLEIFGKPGEYISGSNDTLKDAKVLAMMLPATLDIGYTYSWDNSSNEKKNIKMLARTATAGVNYNQHLSRGPGRSFVPRLSIGGEAGTLNGVVPVRAGFAFGGPEKFASALGLGVNLKYFSINASYKAIGHLLFVPSKGSEFATGITAAWGMKMDRDGDGILDKDDKCPEIPEDFDGFEDKDGCPDYDNDQDGIADTLDKCINDPEDKDNFEDADGCPDLDNDKDGIEDKLDKCPNDPEDKDNFEDDDGCPDLDNDMDGIPDNLDKCPQVPEDKDMFEDEDGCPDYDNDRDGIPDSTDVCMNNPEVFNGYKDTDGCPDTLVKPTEKETKVLNTKLRAINFKTASAELIAASYTALDYVAEFLKLYPHLRYEIQGHTDDQGSDDYNLLLSAARAGTVRSYLLSRGTPDSALIAIGYGETVPIADNKTAAGRALNRRVEFKIIETNDEFNVLKIKEAEFREKVQAAKIKGYK
jgi:outer membrane protein OmpA-like peptidoglycan-associated protein